MIVQDAMVVIHLAKITLLEKSCEYFQHAVIPEAVYDEVMQGKEKGYPDATVVEELVKRDKLVVRKVRDRVLVKRAREFNLQRGEAEALVLYWQEKADYLASDDDSVRKKRIVLAIRLIGTPAILSTLYRERLIEKRKLRESLAELRNIGWFSSAVIDRILMEAD